MAAPLSKRLVSGCCLGWGVLLLLLTGCATPVSRWRNDAYKNFDSALAVAADASAPEETDAVRRTLELAERYYKGGMIEEADGLYRLAGLESRLLYRSIHTAGPLQDSGVAHDAVPVPVDKGVSLDAAQAEQRRSGQTEEIARNTDFPAPPPLSSDHEALRGVRSNHAISSNRPFHPARVVPSRTDPGRSTIYLTFDDGPSRLTLPIASYLKSQGIGATFFVLGCNVKGHEKTVSALVAMGHRVGSHTFSHDLRKLKASFGMDTSEVGRTASLIDRLGGDGLMVRLPYGASDRNLTSHVAAEGAQIFVWDIDSYDSTKRGVHDRRFIEKTVLGQLARTSRRHSIVLFHDGSGHDATMAALKDLVPLLKEQGYRFGLLYRNEKQASLSHASGIIP